LPNINTPTVSNNYQNPQKTTIDKNQFNPIAPFFWVGLDHEQVQIVNDKIAPTRVTIGF